MSIMFAFPLFDLFLENSASNWFRCFSITDDFFFLKSVVFWTIQCYQCAVAPQSPLALSKCNGLWCESDEHVKSHFSIFTLWFEWFAIGFRIVIFYLSGLSSFETHLLIKIVFEKEIVGPRKSSCSVMS